MPVCSRNTTSILALQDRTRLPSLQFRNAPQAVLRGDRTEPGSQPHSNFDGCAWHEKLWAGAIPVHRLPELHTGNDGHQCWRLDTTRSYMHLMCFRTRFFIFSHLTRDRTAFPGRHDILSFYLDQVITTYEICLRSMDHVIEMAGIGTRIISFLLFFSASHVLSILKKDRQAEGANVLEH